MFHVCRMLVCSEHFVTGLVSRLGTKFFGASVGGICCYSLPSSASSASLLLLLLLLTMMYKYFLQIRYKTLPFVCLSAVVDDDLD